jgi:hypothetical protein
MNEVVSQRNLRLHSVVEQNGTTRQRRVITAIELLQTSAPMTQTECFLDSWRHKYHGFVTSQHGQKVSPSSDDKLANMCERTVLVILQDIQLYTEAVLAVFAESLGESWPLRPTGFCLSINSITNIQ